MKKQGAFYFFTIAICLTFFLAGCAPKSEPVSRSDTEKGSAERQDSGSQDPAKGKLDVVKIPGGTTPTDKRYLDVTEALRIALEKTKGTYGDYELVISDQPMTGARFVEEAQKGENINVIWRTYAPELERELLPIHIDPRKGLMGYRVLLIRAEDQEKFRKVRSLEDLRAFKAGQGADWLDVQVFRENGLEVVTGSSYEGLFLMLKNKRFDYFSRGLGEAFTEYQDRKDSIPGLHVEESLLLHYPWPYFYYVNPGEKRIAERIRAGLSMMLEDGSMDELFMKYNGETLKNIELKNRTMIRLVNPLLEGAAIDLEDERLWFDPQK